MKEKEIISRINKATIEEMPDVLSRINLKNIVIEPQERKHFSFNFAKSIRLAVTSIVLLVTGFFVYNTFFSPISNSNTPLESDIEILGFQTITGAVLLDENNLVEMSYSGDTESIPLNALTTESLDIDDYIGEINPYIHLMETILNNNDSIKYQTFESDDPNYAYAFKYTSSDLAKNELTYRVYYNQIDETISGKIEFSNQVYLFEKAQNQIKINIDENNYILVDDNSTSSQQQFRYNLYQNGEKIMENSLEIYKVQNSIQVRTRINKNGLSINLYIQRRYLNNLDELEVDYEIEESQRQINGEFKVNLEFDQQINGYKYCYVLGNNGPINQPRRPFSNHMNNDNPRFGTII
ncbi:MAG: hypothetical protein RQ856_03635 [Candidatus Izemoplasmatales bacterium]|nr:hypothetical protein [Candidatus Izemoplasmatales bacterium]